MSASKEKVNPIKASSPLKHQSFPEEKSQISSSGEHPTQQDQNLKGVVRAREETVADLQSVATETPDAKKSKKEKDVQQIVAASHKTKYLPMAGTANTCDIYFQPKSVSVEGKNWCLVEMMELVVGSTLYRMDHVFSVDADDLLRMFYIADMMINDDIGAKRLLFEEWVFSIFEEYVKTTAFADYSERAKLAAYYFSNFHPRFSFCSSNRLQIFFQKKGVRDFVNCNEFVREVGENLNIVTGKARKGNFDYCICATVFSLPESILQKSESQVEDSVDVPDSLDPLL